MRNRRLVLVLAAFALAGCARATNDPVIVAGPSDDGIVRTDGCATATSPPVMTIDGTPQPANQEALDELAGRVQTYAEAHFADVYTGLELRSAVDRIRVYRKPSAGFDAWITREFAKDCVEVVAAKYSRPELDSLATRIMDDRDYWTAKGISISTVAVKVDGSGVEVGTTNVVQARRELPPYYGAAVTITVVYQDPVVPA